MKTLAERIQSRMDELELGQEALAKKAGISQTAVFKLVSGKTLQTRKIAELANALNVSIEWLATGKGEKLVLGTGSNFGQSAKPPVVEEDMWKSLSPKTRALVEEVVGKSSNGKLKDDDVKFLQDMLVDILTALKRR